MIEKRRVFFGLTLSSRNSRIAHSSYSKLEPRLPNFRWVAQENYHVTLLFVGEIEDTKVSELTDQLRTESFRAFTVIFGGVSRFPIRGPRVRVLHIPMIQGIDETERLAKLLRERTADLGIRFKSEKHFVPHLTIGRARGRRPIEIDDETEFHLNSVDLEFEERVASYTFFESVVTPCGAKYVSLSMFPLV